MSAQGCSGRATAGTLRKTRPRPPKPPPPVLAFPRTQPAAVDTGSASAALPACPVSPLLSLGAVLLPLGCSAQVEPPPTLPSHGKIRLQEANARHSSHPASLAVRLGCARVGAGRPVEGPAAQKRRSARQSCAATQSNRARAHLALQQAGTPRQPTCRRAQAASEVGSSYSGFPSPLAPSLRYTLSRVHRPTNSWRVLGE